MSALDKLFEILNQNKYEELIIDEADPYLKPAAAELASLRKQVEEAKEVIEPFARWLDTGSEASLFYVSYGKEPTTGDIVHAQEWLAKYK
jgi:hypothetical protein